MSSGYASGGTDFDDLFDPDVMGDGPTAAGYSANGALLKYAALSYGTKRADVGYSVAGVDVSNLWAAKGTAVYLTTVTSFDSSPNGAASTAVIAVIIDTQGRVIFSADHGGTLYYQSPVTAGAGTGRTFRVSGTVTGIRNVNNNGTFTGKGAVVAYAGTGTGTTANYDTGWQAADDTNPFIRMQANSTGNYGMMQWLGTFKVEVKNSSGVIERTWNISFDCTADSQT